MKKENYDIIISGAGYIGMSLACLLAKQNLKIAIIDHVSLNYTSKNESNLPSRTFAIASASMEIFKKINIENKIKKFAQPINQILIEDHKTNEDLNFYPQDLDLQNFGYMVDEQHIINALKSQLSTHKNINLYQGQEIKKIQNLPYYSQITLSNSEILNSKLLVVAEGKNSKTRELLEIKTRKISYQQDAIVFDLKHEYNHNGIAAEKFLSSGPFAILPKKGGYESCIVWTDKTGTGKILKSMPKKDITYLIKNKLKNYLGDIELVSDIAFFPLNLIYAKSYFKDRAVFCGDSIHGIHPIAGQGLNLGLRDVQHLHNLINNNIELGLEICSNNMLNKYNNQREFDINLMINSTHNINNIFASNLIIAKLSCKIGLKFINKFTPLKNYIMSYASGYKI